MPVAGLQTPGRWHTLKAVQLPLHYRGIVLDWSPVSCQSLVSLLSVSCQSLVSLLSVSCQSSVSLLSYLVDADTGAATRASVLNGAAVAIIAPAKPRVD
jgi:hypothetical protein